MITDHHYNELQERVQRGMALLDKKRPGWRESINTEILDLSDGYCCVLGQVYNHFITGSHGLGLVHSGEEDPYTPQEEQNLLSHGFYSLSSHEYDDLTATWKQALGLEAQDAN